MSIMVAVGRSARAGVLVKNAEALELLEKVDTLIVDKTGTLTEGKPAFAKILAVPRLTESELLSLAASLEQGSEHPLAAPIVNAAAAQKSTEEGAGFRSITGKGIVGAIKGRAVAFGNQKCSTNWQWSPVRNQAETLRKDGQTVMFLAVDGKVAGLISVADPIKESAPEALRKLRKEGLRIVMLTGDNRTTAQAVAARLGITMCEPKYCRRTKVRS